MDFRLIEIEIDSKDKSGFEPLQITWKLNIYSWHQSINKLIAFLAIVLECFCMLCIKINIFQMQTCSFPYNSFFLRINEKFFSFGIFQSENNGNGWFKLVPMVSTCS